MSTEVVTQSGKRGCRVYDERKYLQMKFELLHYITQTPMKANKHRTKYAHTYSHISTYTVFHAYVKITISLALSHDFVTRLPHTLTDSMSLCHCLKF